MNVCGGCREDFGSLELFDRHRVGTHGYTMTEGLKLDPPRDDGRRCLDRDEMQARGWTLSARGRWTDPARNPRIRLTEEMPLCDRGSTQDATQRRAA